MGHGGFDDSWQGRIGWPLLLRMFSGKYRVPERTGGTEKLVVGFPFEESAQTEVTWRHTIRAMSTTWQR